MARIETWFEQDLKKPVIVHKLDSVFSQDAKGNLIGVKVFSDGVAVALTDSITGYCVLADGSTVPVSGSRSGNQASIILPASAYNVLGPIMITVKNTGSDYATTLCAIAGLVVRSRTGNQVSPGSVVTDWTNQISAQLQAVQTAADNLGSVLAIPFSNLTAYSAGNYVMKDGNLYCFTTDHAAGDWNSSQVRNVKLANEVADLNSALTLKVEKDGVQEVTPQNCQIIESNIIYNSAEQVVVGTGTYYTWKDIEFDPDDYPGAEMFCLKIGNITGGEETQKAFLRTFDANNTQIDSKTISGSSGQQSIGITSSVKKVLVRLIGSLAHNMPVGSKAIFKNIVVTLNSYTVSNRIKKQYIDIDDVLEDSKIESDLENKVNLDGVMEVAPENCGLVDTNVVLKKGEVVVTGNGNFYNWASFEIDPDDYPGQTVYHLTIGEITGGLETQKAFIRTLDSEDAEIATMTLYGAGHVGITITEETEKILVRLIGSLNHNMPVGTTATFKDVFVTTGTYEVENKIKDEYLKTGAADKTVLDKALRFVVITDTHYSPSDLTHRRDGVNEDERMELMFNNIDALDKEKPFDFILHTGDVFSATGSGATRDDYPAQFKEKFLSRIKKPFFAVVGNHDAYTDQEWLDCFRHKKQYSFETDDFYFIVIDRYDGATEVMSSITRNFEDQPTDYEWVESEMIKAKALNKYIVVVAHHGDWSATMRALNVKYDVVLFIGGHSHVPAHYQYYDDLFVSNAGWFAERIPYYDDTPAKDTAWAIDVIEIKNGEMDVDHHIVAHNYTDSGLGNVPASTEHFKIMDIDKSTNVADYSVKQFMPIYDPNAGT